MESPTAIAATEIRGRTSILPLGPAQLSRGGRAISGKPMTALRGRRLILLVIGRARAVRKRGSRAPTAAGLRQTT